MTTQGNFVVFTKQLSRFCSIYTETLKECVEKYPDDYRYGVEDCLGVAVKMHWAFHNGSFSHDQRAIRETCKKVGIKHTRKAMVAYFAG